MEKYTPSKYQVDIFNFMSDDLRNAVVSAVAGSGKTTTLLMAIDIIPEDKSILFLAYNKHIEKELTNKADPKDNLTIKTVHSFGFSAMKSYNPKCFPNATKYRKMFRDIVEFYNTNSKERLSKYNFDKRHLTVVNKIKKLVVNQQIDDFSEFTTNVVNLCNLGRLHNIDIDVKYKGVKLLKELSNTHSISNEYREAEIAWYLTKLGVYYTDEIDYTDMIFLPIILDLETEQYDFVFIDECQDISTCQRILMTKAIKKDVGRFIAVGDPAQSIYGFAGADDKSYNELCKLPNTVVLPLSITYRCAKPIVDYVRVLNQQIEHNPTNTEGEVLHEFSYENITDGDMVLCRQTFPLVSLCMKYLSEGKKAYIIGSDIGTSLSKMITNSKRHTEDYTMINVIRRLHSDLENLIKKTMESHGMNRDEAMNDEFVVLLKEKILAIEAMSKGDVKPDSVIKKITQLFSDDKKVGICLSTVHKSKGLESERVFILHPELLPSKRATLEWQKLQEQNLMYVAYTRAKKTLGFITDYDAFKGSDGKLNNVGKISESKHIGKPNSKIKLDLKIVSKRTVKTKYGPSIVYDMVDDMGNAFSKFGEIHERFLVNRRESTVDVNSKVTFYGTISKHTEFRGVKITQIGNISKF